MTQFQRDSYCLHMKSFTQQPFKIFDCIDFFYEELDVEESNAFLNKSMATAVSAMIKNFGIAMHNGCMPMRLTIMPLSAIMKTITFDDKYIKWSKY